LTEAAAGEDAKALGHLRQARALDLDPTKVVAPLTIVCFDVHHLVRRPRLWMTAEAKAFVAALGLAFQRPRPCADELNGTAPSPN
jgi:hypothetical protein